MSLEALRAEIILGQACDAFFNTDLGKYVKARAEETVRVNVRVRVNVYAIS